MKTATQTVFVVDDDAAVRDALAMLLDANGFRVEVFDSAESFLQQRHPQQAACLVLDVRMTGMSGLELQHKLTEERSRLPIIFLTGHGDVPMAVMAVKRGAFDFVQKPVDDAQLLALVRSALSFSVQALPPVMTPHAQPPNIEALSRRERDVLDLILAGRQTRAIAEELFISAKTVEFHRGRIHEKLGVSSLAELFSHCFGYLSSRTNRG